MFLSFSSSALLFVKLHDIRTWCSFPAYSFSGPRNAKNLGVDNNRPAEENLHVVTLQSQGCVRSSFAVIPIILCSHGSESAPFHCSTVRTVRSWKPDYKLNPIRTLAAQLLTHGRVETTLPRAKKLQIVADKLVTVSKKVPEVLHVFLFNNNAPQSTIGAKQQVRAFLRSEALTQKVFGEMSSHYENRSGGYTMLRVTRTRSGDAAVMATVQYVKP